MNTSRKTFRLLVERRRSIFEALLNRFWSVFDSQNCHIRLNFSRYIGAGMTEMSFLPYFKTSNLRSKFQRRLTGPMRFDRSQKRNKISHRRHLLNPISGVDSGVQSVPAAPFYVASSWRVLLHGPRVRTRPHAARYDEIR